MVSPEVARLAKGSRVFMPMGTSTVPKVVEPLKGTMTVMLSV